jgi:hypothetical protein
MKHIKEVYHELFDSYPQKIENLRRNLFNVQRNIIYTLRIIKKPRVSIFLEIHHYDRNKTREFHIRADL